MKEDELPPGWAWSTLGELGTWYGGGTPSKRNQAFWTDGTVPWLSPKDMGPDVIRSTQDLITEDAVEESATRLVPAGSVAIVTRSGVLEHSVPIAIVPFQTTLNQDMKAIVPAKGINERWLAWTMRALKQEILDSCRKAGTTVASISTSALFGMKVPVPPLAEQERIVDALEDHLSRLDAAVGYLDSISQRAVQFRRAVVGGIVAGSSQNMTTIGDEFEVFVGATPSRKEPKNWHGDVPWVSSGEVAFTKIMETRERIAADAVGNKSTRIHPPGTLLIAMIGEGKTRGQVAILGIEAAHNQNCASIRIDPEKAISEFVYYVLEHRYEESRKASSGGNQPALNKSKVKAIPLPLPDLEVQQRIVDEISLLDSGIKQVRSTAELAAARASRLRDSLLNKAFSGRLVPQDSADEPASALLERIKAERASQPKPTRKRSAKTAAASTRSAPPISSDPAGTFVQEELGL